MSDAKITECRLNPFKRELNTKTVSAATIVSALAVIIAVGGILALLSSQGIHLGAINAIGGMGTIGGSVAMAAGVVIVLTTLAWIAVKLKQKCQKAKASEKERTCKDTLLKRKKQEIESIDRPKLEKLFPKDKDDSSVVGVVRFSHFWQTYRLTFNFTKDATVQDVLEMAAVLIGKRLKDEVPAPSQIKLMSLGKTLDVKTNKKMAWSNFISSLDSKADIWIFINKFQ